MSKPFGVFNNWKRTLGKIALSLGVTGVLWMGIQYHHKRSLATSHLSQAQVYQHGMRVASLFGSNFKVVDTPILWKHSSWNLACQSDDLRINMTIDDTTGRLWNLGIETPWTLHGPMMAPLDTAAEARQVALHRLCDLQIVPQGSRLRLAQPPIRSVSSLSWEMIWTVMPPNRSAPYNINLVLDRRTGLPVKVMDMEKARQYALASME
jgi:hypothetical protein